MRVFARKQHLSLLPPTELKVGKPEFAMRGTLRESLHGWLDSIAPTSSVTLVPRLTPMDVMRVNHATVREGESHRVWPPFIFQKFWSSEVITQTNVQHYQLRDANVRRIS